jgi:hypothetical protein
MKRNKIIAVTLVVMMMVGALVLMSCGGCPGDGDCVVEVWDSQQQGSGDKSCAGLGETKRAREQAGECATFGVVSYGNKSKVECDC